MLEDEIDLFLLDHAPVGVAASLKPGSCLGKWRIEAFIAKGATGEVYRVADSETGAEAAAKVLMRPEAAHRERFRRAVNFLRDFGGGPFPALYDEFEWDRHAVAVVELLEPMELSCSPGDREVAAVVSAVAKGVGALHAKGYVHRDLKPQNIMRRKNGESVIIDFGLMKKVDAETSSSGVAPVTTLSVVDGRTVGLGTPHYSAPEQFSGGGVSFASDIHALGVMVNDFFGGRPPACWKKIVMRATSSIPAQRYSNIREFLNAVRTRHRLRNIAFSLGAAVSFAAAAVAGVSLYLGGGNAAQWRLRENFKTPLVRELPIPGGGAIKFAAIPPGVFQMSNPEGKGTHEVRISRPFWITRACLSAREVCALIPSARQWNDVFNIEKTFPEYDVAIGNLRHENYEGICNKLNTLYADILPDGYEFRLPTEAELEYAVCQGRTNEIAVVDTTALAQREFERKGAKVVNWVSFMPRNEINDWGLLFGFAKGNHVLDTSNGKICVYPDGRSAPRVPYGGPNAIGKTLLYKDGEVDPVRRGCWKMSRVDGTRRFVSNSENVAGLARIAIAPKSLRIYPKKNDKDISH